VHFVFLQQWYSYILHRPVDNPNGATGSGMSESHAHFT